MTPSSPSAWFALLQRHGRRWRDTPHLQLQMPGTWPQFFRHVGGSSYYCTTVATLHLQAPGAPPTLLREGPAWIKSTVILQPYRQVENCCRPWLGRGRGQQGGDQQLTLTLWTCMPFCPNTRLVKPSLGAPHVYAALHSRPAYDYIRW